MSNRQNNVKINCN